ncbi:alpha-amylase family glycosyl hydrolase [Algibacter sp. L4_22]|uniref:alpha-amylase family glycosyl hydrolase n=1 Tax=Algibacter sp. L4_22 TaxID=2942477 RepID=UPI00201B4E06|nr:alpha-amylase family glycosyl hydrolase [Algibacter sp. L4_22]MCL5129145.1 alpha-amylase family glycosyl hydrolase [Algibacter sp. L4_22]
MSATNWFKKAVIYQVFIDRFNGFEETRNSPKFLGGNINGVTQKLDYFLSLGVNVIWLSPFYESLSYHGYNVTDFKKVNSHFGTEEDLKTLISEAHKRGLYIIADFIPNHCSNKHPFFEDAYKNENSKYHDWFIFEKWPATYRCFLDFPELPKLNLNNVEVRNYMIDIADYWMSLGLDGFRLDHAIGPSHKFWKVFRKKMKAHYPQSVFVGEVWCDSLDKKLIKTTGLKNKMQKRKFGVFQEEVQLEYYGELDGVLDFTLNTLIVKAAEKGKNLLLDSKLKDKIKKHFQQVPSGYFMVTFLDNHDVDRFLLHCKGDVKVMLQAFELLLSLDQPVVIYYGTENCKYNKEPINGSIPQSDLAVRAPMDWKAINPQFIEGFKDLIIKYRNKENVKN